MHTTTNKQAKQHTQHTFSHRRSDSCRPPRWSTQARRWSSRKQNATSSPRTWSDSATSTSWLYIHIYVYTYLYIYTHSVYLTIYYIYISLSLYIYIYIHIEFHTNIHIYIYMHIYIYIYIYTYMSYVGGRLECGRGCFFKSYAVGSHGVWSGRSHKIYYTLVYYSILLYTITYYTTIVYSTTLYYTRFYSTVLYSTLLYSTLHYPTLLYSTTLPGAPRVSVLLSIPHLLKPSCWPMLQPPSLGPLDFPVKGMKFDLGAPRYTHLSHLHTHTYFTHITNVSHT